MITDTLLVLVLLTVFALCVQQSLRVFQPAHVHAVDRVTCSSCTLHSTSYYLHQTTRIQSINCLCTVSHTCSCMYCYISHHYML